MRPIEPGCLVVLTKSRFPESVGSCFTVVSDAFAMPSYMCCVFCHGTTAWPLNDDNTACACCLIRIDDDPDAITEPLESEVEA